MKATSSFTAPEQLQNLKGDFYCEIPSSDIYKFSGSLKLEHPKIEDTLPIGIQQLLIRGTTLRNTEWITGLVKKEQRSLLLILI